MWSNCLGLVSFLCTLAFANGLAHAADPALHELAGVPVTAMFFNSGAPGMVVGLVRGSESLVGGLGETAKGNGQEPTGQSVFRLGSISKVMAGELLATLTVEGKLRLSEPLQRFAPPKPSPIFKPIHTETRWHMSRGGRREGAGRPAGSGWRPAVTELRAAAVEYMATIVGSERDPLLFLVDTVFDEKLDRQTRLGAAAVALPYLHPRLSATTVSANHTVTKIDASELLDRIADRIGRLVPRTVDAAATDDQVAA